MLLAGAAQYAGRDMEKKTPGDEWGMSPGAGKSVDIWGSSTPLGY